MSDQNQKADNQAAKVDEAKAAAAETPQKAREIPMREIAHQLASMTRKLEQEVGKRLAAKEDGNLSRAKDFLHEAGQWIEKAALNLSKAEA